MPPETAHASLLGPAEIPEGALAALVSDAVGRPITVEGWAVRPVSVSPSAVSTAAVLRVAGTAHAERQRLPWSVVVKILQSPRHWPLIDVVPADIRQQFVEAFPWRVEADVLGSELPQRLPSGIRTPRVLRIDDLGDDRIALWLEDIALADTRWDLARFTRAARLLGRWAGRRSGSAIPTPLRADAGAALRTIAAGRLARLALPQLDDDDRWTHPTLTADPALRIDLRTLAERVPALLDQLDTLPQAIGHGDACPQNLLVPAAAPDTFVAIDISWQCPHAVGFDLGQLLVGLAHTGELPVEQLPPIREAIVPAYTAGLRDEGCAADPADVSYGCDASLVIRSAFTSIPVEQINQAAGPGADRALAHRVALTRYLIDLGLGLPAGSARPTERHGGLRAARSGGH